MEIWKDESIVSAIDESANVPLPKLGIKMSRRRDSNRHIPDKRPASPPSLSAQGKRRLFEVYFPK